MMFGVLGRAFVLALLLLSHTIAYAHSLPGSILTFSEQGERLNLSIQFALEDLIIAAPVFKSLETAPFEQALSGEPLEQLANYLETHLQLASESKRLPFKLSSALIERVNTGNLLPVVLVSARLDFPMPEGGRVLPLTLTYDALMHEIRSHRASVYWKQDDTLVRIADFGFKRINGKAPRYRLKAP